MTIVKLVKLKPLTPLPHIIQVEEPHLTVDDPYLTHATRTLGAKSKRPRIECRQEAHDVPLAKQIIADHLEMPYEASTRLNDLTVKLEAFLRNPMLKRHVVPQGDATISLGPYGIIDAERALAHLTATEDRLSTLGVKRMTHHPSE